MLSGNDHERQKSSKVGRMLEANVAREGFLGPAEFGKVLRGDR